jgi:transcriptional regulator with XRE-family HTH domain
MESIKQGEKLMLLIKRDPRSNEKIAEAMGVDKSYLPKLYKMERLPRKPLQRAQQVYGVTKAYFTGEESDAGTVVAESRGTYTPAQIGGSEWVRMQEEISTLREEVAKLERMLAQEKSINENLAIALKNLSLNR